MSNNNTVINPIHHVEMDIQGKREFSKMDIETKAFDKPKSKISEENAITLSWAVNWFLLIAKLWAAIVSNSKSVWASLADSLVDLLSQGVLSLANRYSRKHHPDYPVGRSRLEALSVLACAGIMSMASVEVIQYSLIDMIEGFQGNKPIIDIGVILSVGIVLKFVLYIYCHIANKVADSDTLAALGEDHLNDVMSNAAALVTAR
jgi:divalent metal cation (Fe/Co/Zn/Cd) transporter